MPSRHKKKSGILNKGSRRIIIPNKTIPIKQFIIADRTSFPNPPISAMEFQQKILNYTL